MKFEAGIDRKAFNEVEYDIIYTVNVLGEAEEILAQEKIIPSKGKRRTTDHPPIYPTAGASADKMKGDKWKLYELIVRRFLATVAPNAESEVTHCVIDVGGEDFNAEGYVLKKKGWKKYYGKYIKSNDSKLPALKVGDTVDIRSMGIVESETRHHRQAVLQELRPGQLHDPHSQRHSADEGSGEPRRGHHRARHDGEARIRHAEDHGRRAHAGLGRHRVPGHAPRRRPEDF